MKLTVINGSPKGKKSNTKILTDAFIKGFLKNKENRLKEYFLNSTLDETELQRNFIHAETIIIAFPLYTDAMPAMVKEYFETLQSSRRVNPGIKLGFIVQSGFPESYHSFFVARYLKKLSEEFEADYLGTIIKGEGMYKGNEKSIAFTAVTRREMAMLQEFINKIDPNAFVTALNSNEILGNGFKSLRDKVED